MSRSAESNLQLASGGRDDLRQLFALSFSEPTRDDEDLLETDDEDFQDDQEDIDGRPEQSGDDDEDARLEEQTAGRQLFGRRGKKSIT